LTLLGCFSCGIISISASCKNVSIFSAIIIGAISTVLFVLVKKIFIRFEIDDPINQISLHGVSAVWGLISAGIFNNTFGTLVTG